LSLPNAPGLSIITVLLPVFGALNTFYYPRLLSAAENSELPLQKLLPNIFQTLQAIVTTVLATLLLQDTTPGTALSCSLSTKWQQLFASHNEEAIKRIQDVFDCCGFNSIKDRAWPFSKDVLQCAKTFERTKPCATPWKATMQRNSGMELGVVIAVALLQVKIPPLLPPGYTDIPQVAVVLVMRGNGAWRQAWWNRGWKRASNVRNSPRHRPLLEGPENDDEDIEEAEPSTRAPRQVGYDTVGNGSGLRVEPASIQVERNAWDQ